MYGAWYLQAAVSALKVCILRYVELIRTFRPQYQLLRYVDTLRTCSSINLLQYQLYTPEELVL